MAQQDIIIGTADAKTGDTLFSAFTKTQSNFTELYTNLSQQAQNVIVINQESDFPTQDATTITLDANTEFFIGAQFSTAKTFTVLFGASIVSIGPFSVSIIYTGIGTMFNSVTSWEMNRLGYSCTSGTVFNCSGVGSAVLISNSLCTSAAGAGSFTNTSLVVQTSRISGITGQGLSFFGAINILSIVKFAQVSTSATHIALDLGSATFDNIEISNYEPEGPLGSIAISGLSASANINANRVATVKDSTLNGGAMVALSGIQKDDVRWSFSDNSGVGNTQNKGDMFLVGGSETITTGSAGDWQEIGVPVAGGVSWAGDVADRFTLGTNGVLTYIGEVDLETTLSGRATVEKVGGGSNVIEVRFAINWDGTPSDSGLEKSRAQTENPTPTTVSIGGLVTFTTGDNVRVIFSNVNGTSNIIANIASAEVSG